MVSHKVAQQSKTLRVNKTDLKLCFALNLSNFHTNTIFCHMTQ